MTAQWSGYLWVDACPRGCVFRASTKQALAELLAGHRCGKGEVD